MVSAQQVRRLRFYMKTEQFKSVAAAKAGMDEKTARKYMRLGKLPGEGRAEHDWRTRKDPFAGVWADVLGLLGVNPGLEAKTIFEHLQENHPDRFSDGQLRTLQRRIKHWRATEGPGKEVYFPQKHYPGELCQSDFTSANSLGISIAGSPFKHLIYHFVLTYSNWESGMVCFSESFESLSQGLQKALWELGGVPKIHQTDRLSAAVNNINTGEAFTRSYQGLLAHYGLTGRRSNAGCANEAGDVEQRHYRLKRALEQALMLRGSRDFANREAYEAFLEKLFKQLNSPRAAHLAEEQALLLPLPSGRLEACKRLQVRVRKSGTVRIQHNVYSLSSRLIGEVVEARLYAERIDIWYGGRCVEELPRLRGERKHHIQYRHIIDTLVRKPGAFANYRYQSDLFPTHRFRMAYDELRRQCPQNADREYVQILALAAREGEALIDQVLSQLINNLLPLGAARVKEDVANLSAPPTREDVDIPPVDLSVYEGLGAMEACR